MEQTGVQRDTITYSAVIEAVYAAGQFERCVSLLCDAEAAGLLLVPIRTSEAGGWVCDLHDLPKAVALTFVRKALSSAPSSAPGTPWTFITGWGKHSEGEAVLQPAVFALAVDLGFRVTVVKGNSGRVLVWRS